jgi:prepilin-type N-terminal cleavage/methylation domain-containing protein/prepilin-type processing-associated H-X9-DG protein
MRIDWRHASRPGFTLIELLVVIGIITVLVALLFPALRGAWEHANRVKCLATLRGMGQAAQMHATEHRGYMPLAGVVPLGAWPEAVGDASMRKYTCYSVDPLGSGLPPSRAAGLTGSLAKYMGMPVEFGNQKAFQDSLRLESVYRYLTCPSDPEPGTGSTIMTGVGGRGPEERMSYMYNMRVLSLQVMDGVPGLGGNVARVRRPSEVFLFIDGQGGKPPPGAWALFGVMGGETLYDYWRWFGGQSPGAFGYLDPRRHRNRINVVFVDGHGETLKLPKYHFGGSLTTLTDKGTIDSVGVNLGIYK